MKVWALSETHPEGKFLVVRRDGSVPRWGHFVMGARDPCVPAGLIAYAGEAVRRGLDPEYAQSVLQLAAKFRADMDKLGMGNPDQGPHRKDDPAVLSAMRGDFPEPWPREAPANKLWIPVWQDTY